MVLEVLREVFAAVQALLQAGVRDVARDDNGTVQAQARGDGILGEFGEDVLDGLVQAGLPE